MLGKLKINQITLGGLELRNETYMFSLEGLFDHEKTSFESELYSDGAFSSSSKINPKKMALSGYINSEEVNAHINLNKIFSNRNKQELKVDIEKFGTVKLDILIVNVGSDRNNIKSCQLIAYDPYLYSDEKSLSISEYRSGIRLPFTFPITFGTTSQSQKTIDNVGTEISYPIIEIKGPCINPSVVNSTTNETLTFNNLELLANDILIIDNRPRTRGILLNGTNRIDLKNGNWISCISGLNEFAFNRTSSSNENLCTVRLQSRWL